MDYFLQYFNPLLYKNISYLNGFLFYCVLMKRFGLFFLSVFFSFILMFWGSSFAFDSIESLTNEEKIALMLMPAFRKTSQSVIDTWAIKEIVWKYWFAGIILYWENLGDVEWSVRFIDFLQEANKDHLSRLLIATDQEGWYVTRLGVWTSMPWNMALAATNDVNNAYEAAKLIWKELRLLGINVDFAPVVDINNNPANPIIWIRSFSDDVDTVVKYWKAFMQWLHDEWIATSLKHFPWHWDTSTDTHSSFAILNKSYDELKDNELKPFQELIKSWTEMIMTAHIQYPNIEKETYVSKKDWNVYTLPATLSKTILTDILRKDMWYNGVIISDGLDMAAIAQQFWKVEASVLAINAWVDILLTPFSYSYDIDDYQNYIQELADKVWTEIDEETVNTAVWRILKLKEKMWLLQAYSWSWLEEKIQEAKKNVSSIQHHEKEFDIAKDVVTMVKNDDNVLPLNTDKKVAIFYQYASHIDAVKNVIAFLAKDWENISEDNIKLYPLHDSNWKLQIQEIIDELSWVDTAVFIHSLYEASDLWDISIKEINSLIDYTHNVWGKAIVISTQLPYDVAKFKKADAILVTYLANGIKYKISDYTSELPKYWPNVMAGIYMMFSHKSNIQGKLPVKLYEVDDNNSFTTWVLYDRGFGLEYDGSAVNKVKSDEEMEVILKDLKYWISNESLWRYWEELVQAYIWGYENWITTIDEIDNANLWWNLTRIAMAKMLSQYAINVLGKKPLNNSWASFRDVSERLNDDYGNWVTLAYQLWIMWVGIDKFRPFDLVTRAEFATALSRLLYWISDGEPYYSSHLAMLKNEWVLSNDDPNLRELRGYVMLMLMRAAQ